jgi:hypothetical protein
MPVSALLSPPSHCWPAELCLHLASAGLADAPSSFRQFESPENGVTTPFPVTPTGRFSPGRSQSPRPKRTVITAVPPARSRDRQMRNSAPRLAVISPTAAGSHHVVGQLSSCRAPERRAAPAIRLQPSPSAGVVETPPRPSLGEGDERLTRVTRPRNDASCADVSDPPSIRAAVGYVTALAADAVWKEASLRLQARTGTAAIDLTAGLAPVTRAVSPWIDRPRRRDRPIGSRYFPTL